MSLKLISNVLPICEHESRLLLSASLVFQFVFVHKSMQCEWIDFTLTTVIWSISEMVSSLIIIILIKSKFLCQVLEFRILDFRRLLTHLHLDAHLCPLMWRRGSHCNRYTSTWSIPFPAYSWLTKMLDSLIFCRYHRRIQKNFEEKKEYMGAHFKNAIC